MCLMAKMIGIKPMSMVLETTMFSLHHIFIITPHLGRTYSIKRRGGIDFIYAAQNILHRCSGIIPTTGYIFS